ncbi:MurR/RpiR family transcriptional regulator [Gordonia jinhuaensis]|uniref:Transcriptional regulator n=1 Tax=Gordonia jinhuaensis TaxID=1517702 RepID=A0A916TCG0_9ACTN|nr:MurR/RpiR family transcriptional regulator [Gordonia jinhuaensis]GGB39186.1 transcriptional regulator [Gordonia jinhuaensis]
MAARARVDPPSGGTLKHVESLIPSLGPSEQKVAREVVENPREVSTLSAAELAERTATSAATVIRTCQSMGFKGFHQLRLYLMRDLVAATPPEAVPRMGVGDPRVWLPAVFESAGKELAHASAPVDYENFDLAVDALVGARRLLLAANGGSAPVAQSALIGFLALGWHPEAPVDAAVQQLTAASLTPGDLCLCISSSGANILTLHTAEVAAKAGATVLSITGFTHSKLHRISDIPLVCGDVTQTWPTGTVAANIGQFVLVAALQSAAAHRAGRLEAESAVTSEVIDLLADDDAGESD